MTHPILRFSNSNADLLETSIFLQFTLVIICWDGTKWTAYAFANNAEEAEELDPNDTIDDKPEEDRIAAQTGNCLNTEEDPIFDPRLYGIIHIEKDIGKYTEEWDEILWRLKKSFKVW